MSLTLNSKQLIDIQTRLDGVEKTLTSFAVLILAEQKGIVKITFADSPLQLDNLDNTIAKIIAKHPEILTEIRAKAYAEFESHKQRNTVDIMQQHEESD